MTRPSDTDLVEAARSGDTGALAALYERYFDPVYDFALRLTRDRDEAADVAQESFLKAMNAIGGLKQGASFRSWIYTIARNTALNRLERKHRTRPLTLIDADGEESALDVADPSRFASPEEAAEAASAARLVWEAAAGLDPRQLSLLDLHLRKGLEAEEIAAVLGITRNNAYVMLHRLKKAVESAITAYVLWKQAGERCPALAALLEPAAAGGGMTPAIRKTVERHAERCHTCDERRRRLAPLAVFGALAPVPAPPGVRAAGLERLLREPRQPSPREGRAMQPAGAHQPPPAGGPGSHGFTSPSFLRAGALLGTAAGLLALLLVLPFSPLSVLGGDGSGLRTGTLGPLAPDPGGNGGPTTVVITITPPAGSPTAPATPTATATPPPGDSPTPTAGGGGGGATATPTPTPSGGATPTATPTPGACVPAISLPPGTDALLIPAGGEAALTVQTATGCPADFSVEASERWLIAPAGGTVPASSAVSLPVRVDPAVLPAGEGDYPATLTITGPANTLTVTVTARRGGQPPQVLSASATCNAAGQLTVLAQAADDVAVTRVTATVTRAGEAETLDLAPAGGLAWQGRAPAGNGIGTVIVTAFDGAGRQAGMTVTPLGCGG